MSKKLQRQTALLLIAVLAMLPLHGIQAAMSSLGHQPGGDAPSSIRHSGHVMHDSASMPACAMHSKDTEHSLAHHHCNSSGCDMCGSCVADLPFHAVLLPSHNRILPEPGEDLQQPRSRTYTLFRPPKA